VISLWVNYKDGYFVINTKTKLPKIKRYSTRYSIIHTKTYE